MIERASESRENYPLMNTLAAIESIAENYLEEIRKNSSSRAHEVFEKARTVLGRTLDQSRHVMNMIQHFRSLDTIKLEESFRKGRGEVYDSVYQVLRAMQYEFPMEKITILKILPSDIEEPLLPEGHLEAILFQLLYNAREAVGDVSGIITVEAAEITALSPENAHPSRFVLRVSDTGPGIPEEFLANIHDPFFTVENPCRVNGMGLSIVQRLVSNSKGLMRIETSLMGTSYIVEFSR